MKLVSVKLCFLALLAVGCSKPSSSLDPETVSQAIMTECPLSFREVSDSGKLASRPFIRTEHVARLAPAPKLFAGDDPAIFVTLTPQGEKRMLSYTQNGARRDIAAFCGDAEVSRFTYLEPFGNNFRVALRPPGGT